MNPGPTRGAAYRELIAGHKVIALDIETTKHTAIDGAAAMYHPISIGAVVLLNGTRRETFHTLTNPGVPVDAKSGEYNGIATDDLADAPDTAAALVLLDAFLAQHPDADLVCHNALFDVGHLHAAYQRAAMVPFDRLVFDTEFIGIRLRVKGIAGFAKLTDVATRYGIATKLDVPRADQRLHKALRDAQDTAEVLDAYLSEAAASGIGTWEEFCERTKPKRSGDVAASAKPRRRFRAPEISAEHVRNCHSSGGLGARPTAKAIDAWAAQVAECVRLRCPAVAEKIAVDETHGALLLPRLTKILAGIAKPGEAGTVLLALEPLFRQLDRAGARSWYKANHTYIKGAPACEPPLGCPSCVAGRPCLRDTAYQLLTRRAIDYGTTTRGEPVSLLSKQAKKDLYYGKSARKVDTWPSAGLPEMAAHMLYLVVLEARVRRQHTTVSKLLATAVERDLHLTDPHLACEVVRHWARRPDRDEAIETVVTTVLAGRNTNPGYLDLDVWFHSSHKPAVEARKSAGTRKRTRASNPKRPPSKVELRPEGVRHAYRYELHR